MKGFKDSTKVQYAKGGSCYAKGGDVGVKGAAKIAKVMGEFKRGDLHSGSKKGPEVTSKKQATAIALNEARKAGLKIPVKKANGGMVESTSARPVKIGLTDDEKAMNRTLNRAERIQGLEAREEQKLMRETRDSRKVGPKTTEMVKERRMAAQRDVREPLIRNPLMDRLTQLPSQRGEFPVRRATGGLAVMPKKGY